MSCLVNAAVEPGAVREPATEATAFHAALPGYRPTRLRPLSALAAELGLGSVALKDESDRLGLPSFKVLGAAWSIERTLRERPATHTLVAASAGNHGRAVAHVAAARGLRCRVFLPARAAPARGAAIAAEGAEVVIADGDYEHAVALATADAAADGVAEITDVGDSRSAGWAVDGYATLFAEAADQGTHDLVLVPVGVGSLAAAAARARSGARVVGVEPAAAACLTASLAAGTPTAVPTPGTTMAGLDCAEVSSSAWPALRHGIHGTVAVTDDEAAAAIRELARAGLAVGESGAAPLAGLRRLAAEPSCEPLRRAVRLGSATRVLLIATEGPTDPVTYRKALDDG